MTLLSSDVVASSLGVSGSVLLLLVDAVELCLLEVLIDVYIVGDGCAFCFVFSWPQWQ